MERQYWELMHRVLRQYGFEEIKTREIIRQAKNEDEYALALCLLITRLEENEKAD